MYHTSSQRQYWTFKSEKEIAELRRKHNQEYRKVHAERMGLDVSLSRQWIEGEWINFKNKNKIG